MFSYALCSTYLTYIYQYTPAKHNKKKIYRQIKTTEMAFRTDRELPTTTAAELAGWEAVWHVIKQ